MARPSAARGLLRDIRRAVAMGSTEMRNARNDRRLRPQILSASLSGSAAAIGALLFLASSQAADAPMTDWPSYNRTLTSERYVPFDQINKTNVARLKQLCVYDLDVDTSFQTGPLVIDRTLYATTDKEILAIDADTCQLKWRVREDGPSLALRVNRGAAYLDGRLFRGTGEGNVLAYDAATGKKLWT